MWEMRSPTTACELGAVCYPAAHRSRVLFQSPHSESVEDADALDGCMFGGGKQYLLFLQVYINKNTLLHIWKNELNLQKRVQSRAAWSQYLSP